MTIQLINLGAGPDTQTGDTVRQAFTKVNENFTELYQVFGSNGQSNLVGNTIYANNISVVANVSSGNLLAVNSLTTYGNVYGGGFFFPNGLSITSSLNADFQHINSDVRPSVGGVYSLGNATSRWDIAYLTSANVSGNISAQYLVGNGIVNNGQTWTFGANGDLTFPTGGLISNYPGNPVVPATIVGL